MARRVRRGILTLAIGMTATGAVMLSFAGAPRAAEAAGPESLADRLSASTRALLGVAGTRTQARAEPARALSIKLNPAKPVPGSRIDYRMLDARLSVLMTTPGMVGMSVAVVENGQVTFMRGYGYTDAASLEPVNENTVFRWASLSKGVAGTIVADLAAEGRLSLNDPVAKWAPSLRLPGGAEARVTVADVLAHRVGLPKNAYDGKLEGGASPQALRTMLGTLRGACQPATCHSYQNIAFDAATEIVERATGRPYAEVANERFFRPLGMTTASMTRTALITAESWAKPHVGTSVVPVLEPYYRVPAAGGVNSSIADLARWMIAQMGGAPLVIPEKVLGEAHAARVATARTNGDFNRAMTDQNYGLGWRRYTYSGNTLVGHQGAVRGYRSTILFDPDRKTGVAVLWNSGSGRPFALPLEVMDMAYRLPRRDWLKLDALPQPGGGVTVAAAR